MVFILRWSPALQDAHSSDMNDFYQNLVNSISSKGDEKIFKGNTHTRVIYTRDDYKPEWNVWSAEQKHIGSFNN